MLHVAYLGFFISDDAFISMRYARNWAQGMGPVWNPGERVDGYTSFLWTGLLAGASKLGLPMAETAFWGGFAAALAALVATAQLARSWPQRDPEGALRWLPLIVALLLAANGAFATWAYAGLEGPLFAALVVWAAHLHFREDDGVARRPWSSVALLGAALTRPEGVLFFAMTAGFKLYGWLVAGRSRKGVEWLLIWASLFMIPFAIYFGWHWYYYGHPLPNSYYAKVGSGLDQYQRGLDYVVGFGREYGIIFALLIPLPLFTRPDRLRQSLYLTALLAAWTAYVVYIGGDGLRQQRMFVPVLPILYLLAAAGALDVLRMLQARGREGWLWPTAGVTLLVVLAITLRPSTEAITLQPGDWLEEQETIGRWLGANMPDDYVIALTVAGATPYFSRLPTLDMLGINDEHIAHAGTQAPDGVAGHDKYDSEYVLERRPELIIIVPWLDSSPRCREADYKVGLPRLVPALGDLLRRPRLFEQYAPQSVQLRRGKWFNVLVRRDVDFPWTGC